MPGRQENSVADAAAVGWNPFASIAVVLCVPIIFWISAIELAGAAIGFDVAPWVRSLVVTLTVMIVVPLWTGLWLNRG